MNKWFSSDLHFGHKRIQEFCPTTRSKGSVEEMNELIIQAHNAVVRPEDEWYHMGDFSFGTFDLTREVLTRMNGIKRFFRGNHDKQLDLVLKAHPNLVASYDTYKKINIGDKKVVLMHFPIESWDQRHHGAIHIHGHLHGDSHHECTLIKNRFDVGIDNRGDDKMAPMSWDEVLFRIKGQNYLVERSEDLRKGIENRMKEFRNKK